LFIRITIRNLPVSDQDVRFREHQRTFPPEARALRFGNLQIFICDLSSSVFSFLFSISSSNIGVG